MDLVLNNPPISQFLSRYPETIHHSCILALCLLGLSIAKQNKPEFDSLLKKIPKIPPKLNLNNLTSNNTPQDPIHQPSSVPKPSSISFKPDHQKAFTRRPMPQNPQNLQNPPDSKPNTSRSVIDIADSFFNTNLVQEIYHKEMIADRLKVPFRKKWEQACKDISPTSQ